LNDGVLDALSSKYAAMMSIPLATGFCVERWKHVIDVMLDKVPGVDRSNKLRIIQLPEADFNQVLMIVFTMNICSPMVTSESSASVSMVDPTRRVSHFFLNKLLMIQLLIQKNEWNRV
jgi:hypothetical protein